MFWRFVMGAVKLRRRRLFLAFCAMAVAGALATALFTVYSDVEKKLSQQFQAYGANVTIGAANGETTVPLRAADEVRRLGGTAAPFVIALSTLNGRPVILEGVDLGLAGNLLQYWHIEGRRGNCLAGISLGLKIGETVQLRNFSCTVDGIVSTGASEDNRIILPFATVAHLSGLDTSTGSAAASVIQARLPVDKVEALAKAVPQADVRLVQAVAETESNVVLKVRVALFLLMAVILAIVTISVSSNFGELVIERSKEIGILKAIGAGEVKIASLFAAESLILALLATVTGYALGVFLAGWIDQSVFETKFALHANPLVLLLSALVTFVVALFSTGLATGRIWRIQPAIILRGE
jgi:putative ABC transport system permease protein